MDNLASYNQALGRIGYLTANPDRAPKPEELDRLTERYLLKGRRPRSNSEWLTGRQMRAREEREVPLGEHIERASRTTSHWCGTMPRLKRITQPEY